jgi:hypothetical protein
MLVGHEERLLHRLWRDRHERGAGLLNPGKRAVHRLHLPAAERIPSSPKETHHQPPTTQQLRGRNRPSILIGKEKLRDPRSHGKRLRGQPLRFEVRNHASMHGQRLSRHVLSDLRLSLSQNLAQRTRLVVSFLFEGSPLHKGSFVGRWLSAKAQRSDISVRIEGRGHSILARSVRWVGIPQMPRSRDLSETNGRRRGYYIPGIFIPASRRAKLGFPICLNIFFICAYCRSRLFTSCTLVPDPRAMRFRRLPLITS